MDNGIGDVTGVHDAADGLCHADDEGSAQHLFAALKELFGDRGGAKAAQYAFDDSQCEEDSCSLRHIPVEPDAAVDDEDKGCEEDQHDEDLAGVQIAEGVEVRSIAELAGLVELVHGAEFGMLLDLQCVADEVDVRDNIEHSKADKAVTHAGIQRQAGDFLSHDGGVDVQRASGEADRAAQQDDGCTGDGVQTHRKGHHDHDGRKGNEQVDALRGADEAEHQRQDGQEQIDAGGEDLRHLGHHGVECAGLGQDVESTACEHDDQHQINALDEGLDDVQRNFKRVDGSLINVVEIVGVDDLDACFVLEAGVGACRDDPGQQDRKQDDDADDDEGMRHLELFLFRFHNFFLSFDTPKRQLWPFSSLARFSWNSFLMASSFSGSSMSCAPVRARIFAP